MNIIKSLTVATAITLGCTPEKAKEKPSQPEKPEITSASVTAEEVKQKVEGCVFHDPAEITPEEKKLEELRQQSYYEDYAKKYPDLFGDRLYTNAELLCPDFAPDGRFFPSWIRLMQYFLRNGKEKTFKAAEKLGCKYHATVLDENHVLSRLFANAGINITGETIGWIEIPGSIGGTLSHKEAKKYGGKDETIITIRSSHDNFLDHWVISPAKKAGYKVDLEKELEGTIANEMSHDIQCRYFPTLFDIYDEERLDEPFKSFRTEIPGLRFKNNAQAAEFLSDVADWSAGGKTGVYFRFFNPLYYMSGKSKCTGDDRYRYSYKVQMYAMEQVLFKKGFRDAKRIVKKLIKIADKRTLENHDDLFVSAREYFTEDDFAEIASIYRKIGVELLKKMAPYFHKS